MPVQPPDSAAPDGVSGRYGLSLPDADVALFRSMVYGLRAAYSQRLASFEALIMPTVPTRATLLLSQDAPREEMAARALEMTGNTGPFDMTGHSACSVPAGRPAGCGSG
jgi:amidase